jgi:two-component system, OmpR family, sensor kinase
MRSLSLRARLTVWYVAGLGVTLLCFGVLVEQGLARTFDEEFEERLTSAVGVVQFAVRDLIHDEGLQHAAARLLLQLQFVEVDVAIFGPGADGSALPFAGNDTVLAQVGAPQPCRDHPITRQRLSGVPYRLLIRCVTTDSGAPPLTVIVGASERELIATRTRLRTTVALGLLIGIALTAFGGHWLSGKAVAPVRRMSEQVRRIGSENLGERLPVRASDGEIATLARMINDLFDRLAATLGRERQFLANAAHALRTPMAILQGEVAEALQRPELPAATRDALVDIESVASHLGRTVEYLLSLAHRDAGTDSLRLEPIFLDDVVSGTVARLGRLAERRRIRVVCTDLRETPVRANTHVVDQVAQVLLENALQYTPEGGTVAIGVTPGDGQGKLVVEDDGPGLEPGDLDALFTPFARGSAARRMGAPGSGLGLAVARWMVESCGGKITVELVQPHGARFLVEFPGQAR